MTPELRARFLALLCIALTSPALAEEEDPASAQIVGEWATGACKSRDVRGFFDAFISSAAVRQKYSADELAVVTNSASGREEKVVPKESYADFPLAMADYYYVNAEPVPQPGYSHVLLDFKESGDGTDLLDDGSIRVEWHTVVYDGDSAGGDDPGNIIEEKDDPGALVFMPTEECWELTRIETTIPAR
ncbi:MAG: hypothetical protein HC844_17265 [Tabrizicola sp.]|nr:hypothetical protein [Tabrizicola sp.]